MAAQPRDKGVLALTVVIMAALVALFAEGIQLWSGENSRSWIVGAVFGIAITIVATRFTYSNRTLTTGEAPIAVAATGLGVLIAISAAVGLMPPDRNSSTIPTPPLPGAQSGETEASPTSAAGPPTKGTHGVTLISPASGSNVHRCEVFSGTAKVPAGQTLMLAVKNIVNHDPNSYFQPVDNWDEPTQLTNWTGVQFFGSADDSVGQNYEVRVVLLKSAVVKAALAKGDGWYGPSLPKGSQVTLTIKLHRVAGAGPAICS